MTWASMDQGLRVPHTVSVWTPQSSSSKTPSPLSNNAREH